MPELWLVRHGEATNNAANLVTGTSDDPLTERGHMQAKALGTWLRTNVKFMPDAILTSSMIRAIETEVDLGYGLPTIVVPQLNETNAGSVSNWNRDRFDQVFSDFWSPFNPDRPFPDGESHTDMYVRVNKFMDDYLETAPSNEKILVVAHGGTISSLMHKAFSIPMDAFSRFKIGNASLSILSYDSMCSIPSLKCLGISPFFEPI